MNPFLYLAQPADGTEGTEAVTTVTDACGADPGWLCRWMFERTGNELLSSASEWLIHRPLKIILILLGAFLLSRLARRAARGLVARIAKTSTNSKLANIRSRGPTKFLADADEEEKENSRAQARADTLSTVLSSIISVVAWSVALLMILGEFNINIGPLLAGASIAGVAIGFGSQAVVKDFISGLFMLIEDQFGVGDTVDLGHASGTVEAVTLRSTTIRDVAGTVWHIPNGEISRVANKSQLWSRAMLDVEVAYETDLRLAEGVIQRVADELWEDPEWGGDELMGQPEVWGIQALGASGIAIRLVVKTQPAMQWKVERELRMRIKEALDAAGIEIPFPQSTVWLRSQGEVLPAEPPPPEGIPVSEPPRYRADRRAGDEEDADE